LLSYVTIANFRHKHKGRALAGGHVRPQKSAPLPHAGRGSTTSPHKWTTGLA